ncbi:MAG TPA: histidine--tRNA ligase [Anaerolineae bacterium]|nr:histidine--tRNA ligase [Anaerolineae bacterium]
MSAIAPVKGTRDFYPNQKAFQRWMYDHIRAVSEKFGYQEYEGPFLERLELYAAKSGEELVQEQSFVFPDRGGEMIALRPELTPSLARMLATRSKSMIRPIRWWSFGPFWRYERPQKGRSREFFQWNIDLLGVDSPQADAEIVVVAAAFFKAIGLTAKDVRIKVNNRRLADQQLDKLGVPPERHQQVFRLIDRRSKLNAKEWNTYAEEIGLDQEQIVGLEDLLNNSVAWREFDELKDFFDAVEQMGASEYVEYDPIVIRGLDYYTGNVFEAYDAVGEERAILGGGRYDDLVADIGGEPLPGVGFAMGDVVTGIVLDKCGVRPDLRANPADVFIPTFDESSRGEALRLAAELRVAGLKVEWFPEIARLPKQFKYADQQGIPLAVILGPDEIELDQVAIKDLRTGTQTTIPRSKVIERVRELLEPRNEL